MLHHFCTHALHLYQPTRTTDRSQQNQFWHFREAPIKHLPHHGIICRIAQVNQHLSDVIERHFCFLQQGLHVFPHAFGLFPDITRIHHFPPVNSNESVHINNESVPGGYPIRHTYPSVPAPAYRHDARRYRYWLYNVSVVSNPASQTLRYGLLPLRHNSHLHSVQKTRYECSSRPSSKRV